MPNENRDLEIISKQLGRKPRGFQKVMVYNREKSPVVIQVAPIVDGKPFPSMYWLTDETFTKEVSKIEVTGWIKDAETRVLPNDEQLREGLRADNENFKKVRLELFHNLFKKEDYPENYIEALEKTGIGGISDFSRIRCLHMHYAYHLVHGGTIGRMLDEQFNLKRFL